MTSQNRINNQKERIKQIHDIGTNHKSPFITQSKEKATSQKRKSSMSLIL